MKKVLYVHRTQGMGVEGVHIGGMSHGFEAQGIIVQYLSPKSQNDNGNQVLGKRIESRVHSWVSGHMPEFVFELLEICYNLPAVFRGWHKFSKEPNQFIYERYAIFSVVGYFLSRIYGCPLVLEVNYTSRSPLVRRRSRLLKPLAHWVDQLIFRYADLLLPVSGELKNQLVSQYGIDPVKIIVNSNGCDSRSNTCPRTGKNIDEVYCLGFVGGFYHWHGVEILVDAVKILCEKQFRVKCILVGDGPEKDKIIEKVQNYDFSDVFEFAGKVPHESLPSYLDKIDIGILPDTNNYGSPMKLFEYMNFAIPFIAPGYDPVTEICDGQGIIFEKKSAKALADTIEILIRSPALYGQLSKRSSFLAKNIYSWELLSRRVTAALVERGLIV